MVQFHLGKVTKLIRPGKEIFSVDASVHAIVEMWDSNKLTLVVEPPLAAEIKENDVVMVDYNPIEGLSPPVPKQSIVKILRGKTGKECWELFTKYFEEKNRKAKQSAAENEPAGISYSR